MVENRMLRFVTVGRDMPEKRGAEVRRADFREIYAEYAEEKAAEGQATAPDPPSEEPSSAS